MEVESSEQVHGEIARLAGAGLFTEEELNSTCRFAKQDKVWVTGPGGERWEVYTVLADPETFFGSDPGGIGGQCQAGAADREDRRSARAGYPSVWTPRDFPDPGAVVVRAV